MCGFIRIKNEAAVQMQRDYRQWYKDDPSWYAYMGYDQLLFACETLDAFGKYFPLFITGKSLSYSNTNFELTKTETCFQNKYLQIYQLRDRELIPVYKD